MNKAAFCAWGYFQPNSNRCTMNNTRKGEEKVCGVGGGGGTEVFTVNSVFSNQLNTCNQYFKFP